MHLTKTFARIARLKAITISSIFVSHKSIKLYH